MEHKEIVAQLVKEPPGPLTTEQAIPTAIMFLIAMMGGFVAFYRKYKDGTARAFNFTELIGELVVSGLCGVFAYWGLNGVGANPWLTAAGVGIVGHMGSRALFMAEELMHNATERWMGDRRTDDDRRKEP